MAVIPQFVRVAGNVQWKYGIGSGGNYVAVCDPLKLTVQAPTWAELMEDISDVLDAVLKDLLNSKELDAFLRRHGWSLMGKIPRQVERVRFDMPFFFVPAMMESHDSQRNVHQ